MEDDKEIDFQAFKNYGPDDFTVADLPRLDELHDAVGLGRLWRGSNRRAEIELKERHG